jgi:hypothetical protein
MTILETLFVSRSPAPPFVCQDFLPEFARAALTALGLNPLEYFAVRTSMANSRLFYFGRELFSAGDDFGGDFRTLLALRIFPA